MVQTFVPKFSYIIPFRFRQDRILPLRRVIEWLSGFQGVEIIVVEQDKNSKLDYMNLKINHVFIKSEAPFNKSWSFNVGLKRASAPVVIFGDADFIMNPMELIEALKELESYDCVIPTDKVVNLTPQQSAMDTQSMISIANFQPKRNLLDGISIFKKDAIFRIGGWNEDLIGIGYENEFNELKVRNFTKFKQMNFSGSHVYHHPDITHQNLLDRNKQIYDVYKNDVNMLNQHIQQISPKIGNSSRFSSITT